MNQLRICCFCYALLACVGAQGESGINVNYQGKLIQGTNLVNGPVAIVFRIYTNASGGDYIYEETNQVLVVDGYYSTLLGANPNYGELRSALKRKDVFLSLKINNHVMSPRERFVPPPFAQETEEVWRMFGGFSATMESCTNYWPKKLSGATYTCTWEERETWQNTEQFIIYPQPLEKKVVTEIKMQLTEGIYTNALHTNQPTLTAKITGERGLPKRVISLPVDLKRLPLQKWTNLTLIGTHEDRTINTNELLLLCYQANTAWIKGTNKISLVHFQVRVR
ncbi:MAG: hypothetical protein A2498_07120 [Lentisphaerae bacterium RIFOXYC12_FULL_60_16]|nr:MAG: hypothetical protein A2498_07120 [Lentisphaerae bacterium RIFOXYC12_FULL_60_16]OGV78934.1 MAG: hypothetical protein A2340_03295 [Lentisphaerae bacterium RIFOXYB12_FULL_60_10]